MLMGKEAPHHSSFCKSCNNRTFLPRTVGSSLKSDTHCGYAHGPLTARKIFFTFRLFLSASVPLPYRALNVIVNVDTAS